MAKILQAVTKSPATIMHNHYNYSFRFDSISLVCTETVCGLAQAKKLFDNQQKMKFSDLSENSKYLAYCDVKCCITADTTNSKRASDTLVSREFHCNHVALNEVLPYWQSSTLDKFFSEKAVLEIFHPHVISACSVNNKLEEVIQHLNTIVYSTLDRALNCTDSTSVVVGLAKELQELQSSIEQKKAELITRESRKLRYERPITDWLHQHLSFSAVKKRQQEVAVLKTKVTEMKENIESNVNSISQDDTSKVTVPKDVSVSCISLLTKKLIRAYSPYCVVGIYCKREY